MRTAMRTARRRSYGEDRTISLTIRIVVFVTSVALVLALRLPIWLALAAVAGAFFLLFVAGPSEQVSGH